MRNACLYLIVMLLAAQPLKAGSLLVFGPATVSADTVHHSDTITLATSLLNVGNAAYNGSLSFGFAINNTRNISEAIFIAPYKGQMVNIPAGDSLPLLFRIVVQPQYFQSGPDIFVVWPITDNNYTPDSVAVNIVVIDEVNDISTTPGDENFRVYCNDNQLKIAGNGDEPPIDNLAIYSTTGQLMYSNVVGSNLSVSLSPFPAGIYLVKVSFANGKKRMFKVIRH